MKQSGAARGFVRKVNGEQDPDAGILVNMHMKSKYPKFCMLCSEIGYKSCKLAVTSNFVQESCMSNLSISPLSSVSRMDGKKIS